MRNFSTSARALGRTAVSIVPPVHHLVKFKKSQLSPRARPPKSWITSAGFRPQATGEDRLLRHYRDVLEPDLLLVQYQHGEKRVEGHKPRPRSGTSPYEVYQPMRAPLGQSQATKDIKPRTWRNVARLERITLNCFVKEANMNHDLAIAAKLQLQHMTGTKPSTVYAKTNVPKWTLRPGMPMGAKVEIRGAAMSEFVSTLTELVLPRSRTFRGIANKAGDRSGNISFALTGQDVRLFPELEGNLELWPQSFAVAVQLHTSAQTDAEARTLLSGLGFPFQGEERR